MPTKTTPRKGAKKAANSVATKPARPPLSNGPTAQAPIAKPVLSLEANPGQRSGETPLSRPARAAGASLPVTPPQPSKPARPRPKRPAKSAPTPPDLDPTSADLVDTQLAKYRSMRDFGITAEPSGAGDTAARKAAARTGTPTRARSAGLPFVIQKHAASHLHYDFRLGWSGVLKSWAVAKGPSFVVADRRLAVQVEDHPMEYGGFEGTIPKGQYGGGSVMLWDHGTWWPQPGHENVDAGLREGSLKFEMHGTKMRGKWTLIRMHTTRPYPGDNGRWKRNDKPQWLLIKEHDEFERPATDPAITDEAPNSALTGRTMEEIAHQEDHVWNSRETATTTGQAWYRQDPKLAGTTPPPLNKTGAPGLAPETWVKTTANPSVDPAPGRLTIAPRRKPAPTVPTPLPPKLADILDDLPPEPQPEFIQPQLAQETETPPEGSGWLHELKLDGYRMQARKSARGVQMLTRSGLDWTYRVQAVADAVAQLRIGAATLDGEVVVLAEDGTTNFADLQASFQEGAKNPLTFFCFDLLHLEGRNTRNLPLRERKDLLAKILPADESGLVRLSEHLDTGGGLMFQQACQLHAEGIISKRADVPYRAGRNGDWLKAKCLHEQEFVIGGFTLSSDGPDRVGSLLLGYYPTADLAKNTSGKLIYAGRTGTGFTQKMRRELRTQVSPLETKTTPFLRPSAEARKDALWVEPKLVAQVRFATWTADDHVRQAAFLGLREDKRPEEVVREIPLALQPKSNARKYPSTAAQDTDPTPTQRNRDPERSSGELPASQQEGRRPKLATPPTRPLPPTIRLTHPKKILDPESGLTKQQLADYYWTVAPRMLPHIADRPLSLVRCPDGAGKPCFYQKHVNSMLPPGIGSVMVADKKGGPPEPYITLNTAEALAGLAQMGVLEVHPWGSHNSNLECPDRLTFDLDPDETLAWSTVAEAAREVRARLKKIGLESFLKTTGGKGLHIVAPIAPQQDFATVKDLAHRFVLAMERNNPRLYLTKMTKAARIGKIYLDYLRNERGATAVAPFSPRARPGINASVPLDWTELNTAQRPSFSVRDFASWSDRLRRDPWKRMASLTQNLDPSRLRTL